MKLNVSDIMVLESALRAALREYERDARLLTESSVLRSFLLEDAAKATRLSVILKNAVSAEVHLFEDSETAA